MLYETLGDLQPGEEKGTEGMLIIRVSGSVVGENRWAEVGNSLILQYLTRGGKGQITLYGRATYIGSQKVVRQLVLR